MDNVKLQSMQKKVFLMSLDEILSKIEEVAYKFIEDEPYRFQDDGRFDVYFQELKRRMKLTKKERKMEMTRRESLKKGRSK